MRMPEKQVVESGSNENGSYIKFSDGTLICRKNGITAEAGTTSITVTLPSAFIDKDYTVIPVNAYANSATIHWNRCRYHEWHYCALPS